MIIKNKNKRNFEYSFKKPNLSKTSLSALVPNIVTLSALCCGVTSVRMAVLGAWDWAIISILLAAFLDAMDGRLARMLNSASKLGAELDSFSDLLSFGMAPALVIYLNILHQWDKAGWVICLFFIVCTTLRLARFNIHNKQEDASSWQKSFFTGVPSPAGAYIALLPLIFREYCDDVLIQNPFIYAIFLSLAGILMVSRLPTFAFKNRKIHQKHVLPLIFLFFAMLSFLYNQPWLTLSILGLIYLLTIPFAIRQYNKNKLACDNHIDV